MHYVPLILICGHTDVVTCCLTEGQPCASMVGDVAKFIMISLRWWMTVDGICSRKAALDVEFVRSGGGEVWWKNGYNE